MKKFKKIKVFSDYKLTPDQVVQGTSVIRHFLKLVDAEGLVEVEIDDLVILDSFYIVHEKSGRLLEEELVLGYLYAKVFDCEEEFINILFTQNCVLMKSEGIEKVVQGLSVRNHFAIIALGEKETKFNSRVGAMTIIHELGHVYGLPNQKRKDCEEIKILGSHCPNICIMSGHANIAAQIDWYNEPFCEQCSADIHERFKK